MDLETRTVIVTGSDEAPVAPDQQSARSTSPPVGRGSPHPAADGDLVRRGPPDLATDVEPRSAELSGDGRLAYDAIFDESRLRDSDQPGPQWPKLAWLYDLQQDLAQSSGASEREKDHDEAIDEVFARHWLEG